MSSFETENAAKEFVRERIDVPINAGLQHLGEGMNLRSFSIDLDDGIFTNVYDLSIAPDVIRQRIEFPDKLTSVLDQLKADPTVRAAISGGFFFLADRASGEPRELGLNLALSNGHLLSFPVVDREALIAYEGRLSARDVQALGVISINGEDVEWSGSLTSHDSEARVFGNGNSVIAHVANDVTGSVRTLDETSRYTPTIETDDVVDIGFMRREDGSFVGTGSSKTGRIDTFKYDATVRLHERHSISSLPEMLVRTVGSIAIDGSRFSAVSVGPMLDTENFTGHSINNDPSLGGRPPFLDVPLARAVVFSDSSDVVHYRLFDGRPGSSVFPGITPSKAAEIIREETEVVWGCFLDPGQTAKMVTRHDSELASYGNRHYLKWPIHPGERFVWVPETGRPVASVITLR